MHENLSDDVKKLPLEEQQVDDQLEPGITSDTNKTNIKKGYNNIIASLLRTTTL
jgi:hypothetical protein